MNSLFDDVTATQLHWVGHALDRVLQADLNDVRDCFNLRKTVASFGEGFLRLTSIG